MEFIDKYFPELPATQRDQLAQLDALYRDWNQKINVISRKDIDNLYLHHVLHSMAIAKVIQFVPGAKVLDLGTGGGFPQAPRLFPNPASSEQILQIQWPAVPPSNFSWQLFSTDARLLHTGDQQLLPHLADYPRGYYVFKLRTQEAVYTLPLLIQ